MRQVSVAEAAFILGVSEKTIQRRVSGGKLDATKVGTRRYVLLPDEALTDTSVTTDGQEPRPTHRLDMTDMARLVRLEVENEQLRERLAYTECRLADLTTRLADGLTLVARLNAPKQLAPPRPPWRRLSDTYRTLVRQMTTRVSDKAKRRG